MNNREPRYQIVHTPIGYIAQKKLWWWPFWYRLGFQQADFTNYYTDYGGAEQLIESDKRSTKIAQHPKIRRQRRIDNLKLLTAIFVFYMLFKLFTRH